MKVEREEDAACSWHNFRESARLGGNKQIDKSGQQTALFLTLSLFLFLPHTLRDLIQENPGEPAKH